MASNCIDLNNKITQNLRGSTRLPAFDGDGAYTFQQINVLANDFVNSIVEDQETNPIKVAINKFGELDFYSSLTDLNAYLRDKDLTKYPDLNGRYIKGAIGGIEYADFLDDFAYSTDGIGNDINNNSLDLLRKLDNYYKNSFSTSLLGGFCNQIQGVFGAIDAFFDIVDSIQCFISDALSFINNLEQSIADFGEKVAAKGLVTVIKEQIEKVLTEIWKDVLSTIQQFGAEMENIFRDTEQFINDGVIKRAEKIQRDAEEILNEDNEKTLKQKINDLIDYAVSLFERPTLDEIQFLVLRFCSLISNVEALINEVKRPATTFSTKYQAVVKRLERVSASAEAAAIAAGGIRYTEERRKEELERMAEQWTSGAEAAEKQAVKENLTDTNITVTELPPSQNPQYDPNERKVITPAPTTTADGNQASPPADSDNTVLKTDNTTYDDNEGWLIDDDDPDLTYLDEIEDLEWPTPDGLPPDNDLGATSVDMSGIESYDTIKNGGSFKFAFKPFDDGSYAWNGLDPDFRRHLYKIQEAVGKKLIISSGRRTVQTNNKYGGAKSSYHLTGFAVDISADTQLSRNDQAKLKAAVEKWGYQLLGGPLKLGNYDGGGHWHIEPGDVYTKALANAADDDLSDLQVEEQTPGFDANGDPIQ